MIKQIKKDNVPRLFGHDRRHTQDIVTLRDFNKPRLIKQTIIDFDVLTLPADLRLHFSAAFWSLMEIRPDRSILTAWAYIKVYGRFLKERQVVKAKSDINYEMLVHYIAWLNEQSKSSGASWSKSSRYSAYSTLRSLLRWLTSNRPEAFPSIIYPYNPFPWRNRDTPPRAKMPARVIQAILRACEVEISNIRNERKIAEKKRKTEKDEVGSLGWLLEYIEINFDGMIPDRSELRTHPSTVVKALRSFGGKCKVEQLIYPRTVSLLPYYLAIMIHTAGNPESIAELTRDCLQEIPLLDDRLALIWKKSRAKQVQRRTFSRTNQFEPPALVADLLAWNEKLISRAPIQIRDRLFIFKADRGIAAFSSSTAKSLIEKFCVEHKLERFSLATIRPGVLTSFYRASGSLQKVSAAANHANLSTTVRYVETPEVRVQNQTRVSILQEDFLGHIRKFGKNKSAKITKANADPDAPVVSTVSMFGFDCKDPLAGLIPGSHKGELCTQFLRCFTCPNAIIDSRPSTLARLLQARDHFVSQAPNIHPARWQALYEPQLRILKEDILTRFSISELAEAELHRDSLPPLPSLR